MIGNQEKKRAALSSKLKHLWNAGPEVSYNMSVRSGLFRVAISEEEVIGFLDDKPIRSIKIEDLDAEIREALENNPEEAGALIMEELINAQKEGKLAMSNTKITKESKAGENNYDDQLSGITERQLKDAGPLYDREDEERKDITEKQLGDKGYDEYEKTARVDEEQKSITEKQLKDGKNPNKDTSPREDEERKSITQKQLEGGSVNSRKDDEKTDITQKQMEKDFRNDEIKSITEKQLAGSEQDNDKVLVRRLAGKEAALEFARKVAKSTARTIKSNDLDKDNTVLMLRASVKNFTSQKKLATKLAQMLEEGLPPEDLDMEAPEDVAGDILADEEVGGSYETDLVINVLKSLVENPKFSDLVNEAMAAEDVEEEEMQDEGELMDEALGDLGNEDPMAEAPQESMAPMASNEEEIVEAGKLPPGLQEYQDKKNKKKDKGENKNEEDDDEDDDEEDDEKEASSDDDGLVAVEGLLAEIKKEAGNNKDIEKVAFAFSRKAAGKELGEGMTEFLFETDEKNGTYRAIFINPDVADTNSTEVKELMAKREKIRVEKLSSSLDRIVSTAQAMPAGGGIPNMAPGGEPAGGGTTLPAGPADMGLDTPAVESFDTGEGEDGTEDISENNEPTPPGTRCPVCGSDDVDVENGTFECNNCNSDGDISVSMTVKRWPGTLEDSEGAESEDELGEGTELGGEELPPMPMAASVYRINQGFIKEAINSGKGYIKVGEYCPNCGSDNTDVDHKGNGKCFSCSQMYISKISHNDGEFKGLTIWQPTPVKPDCPECKAKTMGAKMAKKYPKTFIKKATTKQFPYEDCVNKIAKRYGLNAVALSGDCAGKPLIDCICKKMKSANRYSQTLMMALASRLTEKDPMEECIEDCMRDSSKKFTVKEACVECEKMRTAALNNMPEQEELEFVASQSMDKISGIIPGIPDGTGPGRNSEECPFHDDGMDSNSDDNDGFGLSYNIDNFSDDMVTLSPEDELLEQIRQLLEVMRDFVGEKTDGGMVNDVVIDEGIDGEDNAGDIVEDTEIIVDENPSFDEDGDEEDDDGDDEVEFIIDDNDSDDDGDDDDGDDDGDDGENFFEKKDNEEDEDDDGDDDDDDDPKDDGDNDDDDDEEDKKNPFAESSNEKNMSVNKGEKSANRNSVENKEGKVMDLDKVAQDMNTKKIKRYSDDEILRTADTMQINDLLGDRKIGDSPTEKEVDRVTSQDTKDVGKIQDNKTMGAEEKFDAKDPDVPERGNGSTMGEGEEMPEGKAKIPAGSGAMRKEKEIVDTNVSTEADGRVASKDTRKTKTAAEKKVEDPKPVDQSKDLKNQKLKDTMEMGAERETGLTPDTLEEPDVPQDNQVMGPDESKDMKKPSIPAGDGGMGHEDETVGTDVSVETKGTTIATMKAEVKEAQVKAERVKLATKLAALELMDGEITTDEFDNEISKLATSSVQTLKTLVERYQTQRAKKLNDSSKISRKEEIVREAKAVGLETPLVIEAQASGDLKDKIMSMFSLEKTIRGFEENTDK